MHALYTSLQDQEQHAHAIHRIARQYHIQESVIRTLYEEGLHMLKSTAHIHGYLSVLVTRHVVEYIRNNLISTHRHPPPQK